MLGRLFGNKRGIELSVNFVVILILSLVIFGGGVALMYKVFSSAENLKSNVDSQTQERIEDLLSQGQRVVVPDASKAIERGKLVQFALGVANEEREAMTFTVEIAANAARRDDGNEISDMGKVGILYVRQPYTLEPNKRISIPFGFTPAKDAEPGTYIFNIVVRKADGSQYDYTQKAYVEVK